MRYHSSQVLFGNVISKFSLSSEQVVKSRHDGSLSLPGELVGKRKPRTFWTPLTGFARLDEQNRGWESSCMSRKRLWDLSRRGSVFWNHLWHAGSPRQKEVLFSPTHVSQTSRWNSICSLGGCAYFLPFPHPLLHRWQAISVPQQKRFVSLLCYK